MPEKEFYYTIDKSAFAEFRDRGSKFIAYIYPVKNVDDCKQKLSELKKAHAKATHHCFAYRIGIDGNNYRSNDDGEPSDTAGRPILGQIDSRELTNVMVIVVRYFGGSLLGTAGLIHAYKSAAAMAIQLNPVLRKPVEEEFIVQFDYTRLNEMMVIIKQCNCRIIKQEIQLFCRITIAIARNRLAEFQYQFENLRSGEFFLEKV